MILLDPIYTDLVPAGIDAQAGLPFLAELRRQAPVYGLTDPEDEAVFLAHALHESKWFTDLEENLNYSWKRLMAVWPSRFLNPLKAKQYERQPQKLANFVYGGRLGNHLPNDGWYFRGRGIFMTTGRDNYRDVAMHLFGETVTLMKNPGLLTTPQWAVASALRYWKVRKMKGVHDLKKSTKLLNGGTHGLADRIEIYHTIYPWVKAA